MIHACCADNGDGTRCRQMIADDAMYCHLHPKGPSAPRPNRVLVKFRTNKDWIKRFLGLGVPERTPDIARNDLRHTVEAISFGRDSLRYRNVPDSGVPVFGKQGASNVSLSEAWKELLRHYRADEIHLEPTRSGEPWMRTLVITLVDSRVKTSTAGSPEPKVVEEVQNFFSTASFGFVHLWVNPPKPDGTVVHTVNASHRKDEKPKQTLRFNEGLWALESMAS